MGGLGELRGVGAMGGLGAMGLRVGQGECSAQHGQGAVFGGLHLLALARAFVVDAA